MCGLAPSRLLGALSYGAGGWEHADIRMLPTGKVEVVTGASPHGQGHETAWSQIVADRLGVPFEDVEVLHGDTQVVAQGPGHLRLAVAGGRRRWRSCTPRTRSSRRPRPVAAHLLEAIADDLEFASGQFTVKGTDQGMGLGEVALAVFAAHDLPDGRRADARRRRDLRPRQVLVPARHAPVRHRGRHRDRRGQDPQLHLRRRHRQRRQPADRRGAGPRRHSSRASPRRCSRRPCTTTPGTLVTGSFVDYLVPSARRPARLHDRPHRVAVDHQRARDQGRRRGRHHRVDAGRGQRGRRRAAAFGVDDIAMPCSPHRVWQRCRRRPRATPDSEPVSRQTPPTDIGHLPTGGSVPTTEADHDPRSVRLPAPTTVDEALAALAEGGDEVKVLAGGQSLLPGAAAAAGRPDDGHRPRPDRGAAAASATTATRSSSAR